uniref:CCHC-type domain-containing protein n=1 Tax=Trichogramma kaykai TaxID=54128 RepID=A0ABD2W489_9HYME
MPNEIGNYGRVEPRAPYVSQREVSRNYLAEASEAERRTLIEEQYPGFADFINRRNPSNEMQSGESSQSDAHSDTEIRDELRGSEKHSASVDELAAMFGSTNFNTSSAAALSMTRADEVLVDVHTPVYGPPNSQMIGNSSSTARSVRFQGPLINNTAMEDCTRVVNEVPQPTTGPGTTSTMTVGCIMNETLLFSSSPKSRSNTNPFFGIDNSAEAPKADDELMELLSRITNYVKTRDQGHSQGPAAKDRNYTQQAANQPSNTQGQEYACDSRQGGYYQYKQQAAKPPGSAQGREYVYDPRQGGYYQYDRGYEAPMQPSSEVSLVRRDAQNDYTTGRVPYVLPPLGLFNDIIKQIPKFDGKPNKLKLFCTAVEEAVAQLPAFEQKIVRALQPKLVGEAEYIIGNLVEYKSARDLLRDLQDRFENSNVADSLAMQLGTVRQQAGEDVRKYGGNIRSLYDNAVAAYKQAPDINASARASALYSLEDSVVECFLGGLLEPLQTQVRFKNPKTLAEAIEAAGERERRSRYLAATGSNIASVGLVGVPSSTGQPDNTKSDNDKRVTCQVCQKSGHSALDCNKIKVLHCSTCNKRGHEASTCNRAKSQSSSQQNTNNTANDNNDSKSNNNNYKNKYSQNNQ